MIPVSCGPRPSTTRSTLASMPACFRAGQFGEETQSGSNNGGNGEGSFHHRSRHGRTDEHIEARPCLLNEEVAPTIGRKTDSIDALAPGRLRLGVGTSHRHVMENVYGLSMPSPLAYLREYVQVMRQGLWEGRVDHQGTFFEVATSFPRQVQMPLPISALGEKAFRLAGEIADGAISWVCPVPYLLDTALPALRAGAQTQHRPAPPLVAHILVAMSTDEAAVQAAAKARVSYYTKAPFYAHMFAAAGFPIAADGTGVDALVKALVVAGDQAQVEKCVRELLASGLDELVLMLVPGADEAREREQLMQVIDSL